LSPELRDKAFYRLAADPDMDITLEKGGVFSIGK
jgi:hypothetical protein